MFSVWFYNFIRKMAEKKQDDTCLRKENRRKTKYCYHNDSCRWKRDSFSNEAEITTGTDWIKILKQRISLKNLMNLIETNYHINMTSDHFVSSNNSFKSHLNAKSFNMLVSALKQWCEARWFYLSVCCNGDMNV